MLDEVQRTPDLPSYLQGLIDEDPRPGRWILTGSQNLSLLESVSQTLAGRTAVLNLLPLSWSEVLRFDRRPVTVEEAVFTGGYPAILDRGIDPSEWLGAYVATYVERDVRTISNVGDLVTFQRFVELCAGRTSQLLNYSTLAADCGVTQPTAKSWLSILETSFLAQRLPALHDNLRKRLVKMPKLHMVDSGLACWLLGIREPSQLRFHPLRGPLFESWVVSEVRKHRVNRGESTGLSFYRDRDAAEVDLVVDAGSRRTLVAAKSAQTPSASLFEGVRRVARLLDEPDRPTDSVVVYAGDEVQRRSAGELVPWDRLHEHEWVG